MHLIEVSEEREPGLNLIDFKDYMKLTCHNHSGVRVQTLRAFL